MGRLHHDHSWDSSADARSRGQRTSMILRFFLRFDREPYFERKKAPHEKRWKTPQSERIRTKLQLVSSLDHALLGHLISRPWRHIREAAAVPMVTHARSEEHMSELQLHSFISYAVFCLKKNI